MRPPKQFIYVGTVASYGHPYKTNALKEKDFLSGLPHIGEYGYAMAKRFGFDLANSLRENEVKVTYAVMTNLFGPNDNFNHQTGHVIPSLIARSRNAKRDSVPLEVWGRPTDTRDFLYSGVAAQRLLQLLTKEFDGTVNIGSGIERSIASVVDVITSCLQISDVRYKEVPLSTINHRVLDIELLETTCGKIPDNFEENLRSTISWLESNHESARS
jgi:GDP-L-fucose synthase